jgi:nitric oxide reductase large subunit
MRNGWTYLVAGVTVLVYIIYIAMAVWTFLQPAAHIRVVTESGQLLFTAQDVIEGKVLAQKYGLSGLRLVSGLLRHRLHRLHPEVLRRQDQGAQRALSVERRR